MAMVAGNETVIERGQGVWLWDSRQRRYLDATAGLWYCFVGHGRAELADVAAAQMRKLAAYSAFGDLANEPAIQLAERVAELSPLPDAAVFFTSGGSESIDTAAKLVRRYWTAVGQPRRQILVTREGSYHGVAGYGTSLAGIEANSAGYGELLPGVVCVPPDDAQALAETIDKYPGQVAAFFGEPVRGAGGVYPPKPGYWTDIQKICRERNILLVVDEVVTGFGRLGYWFASSRLGIVPDIITGAKGLTSGYLPLGVVIVGPRVQEPFWQAGGSMFRHGYTYSGHATACAIGLANLEIIEREHLLERVTLLEPLLASEMRRLLEHPLVSDVRSIGLTAAFQLTAEALAVAPTLAETVLGAARERGVLSRSMLTHSIQISPPLIITEEEIAFMTDGFLAALDHAYSEITALQTVKPTRLFAE
jgi:putrescine aminotransferase